MENEVILYSIIKGAGRQIADNRTIDKAIASIFSMQKLDHRNEGTENWNPLSVFIKPGQNVLIKPNMVLEKSHKKGEDYFSVVTHPQIIRTVTHYVYKALQGTGRITIGDAPINSADYNSLCKNLGLTDLQREYAEKGFHIELADFRLYIMTKNNGIITELKNSVADSNYVEIEMDGASAFKEVESKYRRFRVTEYDPKIMPSKHKPGFHRYCFHVSALEADVVISLPKIKTHRKTGFTCAMKNLVGLNGNKDYLPHHTKYSIKEGGDEYLYPSARKRLISFLWEIRWRSGSRVLQKILLNTEDVIRKTGRFKPFRDPYFEGSWWGNETISRTVCDLNRALLYSDISGKLNHQPQRKVLYLVDGIICGEGEGPMEATPKICNMLLWGENSFAIDLLACRLIGYDEKKIHFLKLVPEIKEYPVSRFGRDEVVVRSNLFTDAVKLTAIRNFAGYKFFPPKGWKDHIELEDE